MKLTIEDIKKTIQDFLWVETKEQKVIPFILNSIQCAFIKIWAKVEIDESKPFRVIILKGRQFGFSTIILAIFFIKCLLVKNTRAVVISHDEDGTKRLFRRVRFFANTLILKPSLDKESEKEYSFPKTNSYFYIGTAGAKSFGRGDMITDLHCSEVAQWHNAATLMNGLLQAVSLTGRVIIETTANGVGNYLHNTWKESWQNPKSAWLALFFKWTNFPEYQMKPEPDFERTPDEELICRLHPEITDRQLAWRRWKIAETKAEPGMDPIKLFQQEYPLTPREAFISSGSSCFSLTALESYDLKDTIDIEDEWKIWQKPSGYSIMSIDVAEGLENHDRTVIDIYNQNLEQVAHWAGWIDTDEVADRAIIMADRYKSYIICEINNMGIAVQNRLKKKYNISKQYHREVFDEISRKKVKKLGWRTTTITRGKMVADLAVAIRNHEILFNNPDTIDECMSFIKKNGKYQADEGANDDRVITAGLALQAYIDRLPVRKIYTPDQQAKMDMEKANTKWRRDKIKKARVRQIRKSRGY